jgi:DNA repair exonuclease SbcCD ATPase subunit
MIKFKTLSAKNILSIGNEPVEVQFKRGLNIIFGVNKDKDRSNGAGKSSVVEAIYFALYGKTIRGLNKSDIVNKKTKKGLEVELTFSIGKDNYKIVRKIKPSELALYKNDKDVSRDSIANTQGDIDSLIGVSEDVIKNCVIMGINQTVPFMAQSKVEKRKFIEGIFDMEVFSGMLKAARKDYNDKMKELTSLESKNSEKKNNYEIYKEQSEKFEENKVERIEKLKIQIKEQQGEKKKLESQLKEVDDSGISSLKDTKIKLFEKLNEVRDDKLSQVKEKLAEVNADIRTNKSKIDNMFTSGVCPTCNREMGEEDKEHAQKHIDEFQANIVELTDKKEKLEHKIKEINGVIDVINQKIEKIDDDISLVQKEINNNDIINNRIADCDRSIKRLLLNVKEIKEETNNLDEVIVKVEGELESLKSDIKETSEDIEVLDKIKFICGENGVKSYIINKLLGIFNNKINYYLQKLNANCVLTFDEFFEEKIVNDKNHECSYFNFSSGERRNIDIAIMFAFMDLQKLQGKFDTNVLCFDELCDSSLDVDGVGYVMDILLGKCEKENKGIYLITHRKELHQHATGDIIKVVKENGISKIES